MSTQQRKLELSKFKSFPQIAWFKRVRYEISTQVQLSPDFGFLLCHSDPSNLASMDSREAIEMLTRKDREEAEPDQMSCSWTSEAEGGAHTQETSTL